MLNIVLCVQRWNPMIQKRWHVHYASYGEQPYILRGWTIDRLLNQSRGIWCFVLAVVVWRTDFNQAALQVYLRRSFKMTPEWMEIIAWRWSSCADSVFSPPPHHSNHIRFLSSIRPLSIFSSSLPQLVIESIITYLVPPSILVNTSIIHFLSIFRQSIHFSFIIHSFHFSKHPSICYPSSFHPSISSFLSPSLLSDIHRHSAPSPRSRSIPPSLLPSAICSLIKHHLSLHPQPVRNSCPPLS